jgi:hypothetical protein
MADAHCNCADASNYNTVTLMFCTLFVANSVGLKNEKLNKIRHMA